MVISSRKAEPCEAVAQAIRDEGGEAVAIPAHAGDAAQLQHLVEETQRQFGPVDILVCNAAANPYYGPLAEISDEAYHKTLDTNVLGSLRLAALVMPDMVKSGGGSVLFVSSVGSLKGTAKLGAYGISKAAMNQMVRALAVEWGPSNIRVNAILPGLVKTDFARALWENPEAEQRASKAFPLGRLGEPDDLGPAAVFLASRAGAWMTGQMLVIDGGGTIAS